ncbi:MAG: hypothetical protein WBQ09_04410 [Terriglobales bacterium]|jgi:uncharacterized protein involved in exopolysaccharide biosynthesis
MEGQEIVVHTGQPAAISTFTTRDLVAMGFRHRKALLISFFAVLVGTAITAEIMPRYEAHTEILVHRERVDPVVSAQSGSPMVVNDFVTEEQMNSEAELLKSDDVLRPVVLSMGLDKEQLQSLFFHRKPEEAVFKAVAALKGSLRVEALPKTDVIKVTLPSTDPKQAAQILSSLDDAYLQKHKELHNPAGQFAFFDEQAKKSQVQLAAAEEKLKAFPQAAGTPNPGLARDIALQKINDFNFSLGGTRADLAEAQQRITALEGLQKNTDVRLTTQEHKSDDGNSLRDMKSKLLDLELRKSDLSYKYQADYPPLVEIEREIAHTQASINGQKPLSDVTTDRNPTFTWIDDELVKAKAQVKGDEARIVELEAVINQNMQAVRQLDVDGVELKDLTRATSEAETNYLLYAQKREQARITDALDTTQIVNVAIQERPTVPMYPAQSGWLFALIGTVLALTVSTGVMFMKERMDVSFRTPAEVETILSLPVLAAVPSQNGNGYHSNGNGRKTLAAEVVRESL